MMATATDISNLSFTELKKRIALIQEQLGAAQDALKNKRGEELKVLADGYAKKLEADGFKISEGIEAMSEYLPAGKKRPPRGSKPQAASKPYVVGTVYQNPEGKETWTGGTKGQLPRWLKDVLAKLNDDEKSAKFTELVKK